MRIRPTMFRGALLGSTLAIAVLGQANAATMSRAEQQRIMAATGAQARVLPNGAVYFVAPKKGKYDIVHNFAGGTGDGGSPTAEVTLDSSGNIYGTTNVGGANGGGVLFELTSGGKEKLLHSFGASGDGSTPDGAVYIDSSGNIFGTTQEGGTNSDGTIFELASDGTYTVLHDFDGTDGDFIRGRLTADKKGNLYGTALFGGTNGYGAVFEYSAKGKFSTVHAFDSTDGEYPEHGVVIDKAGNLYGATAFGGTAGEGTVYEISKKGKFSTLYNFTGGTDGGFLYGAAAVDSAGNVYGNTDSGGTSGNGTAFKVAPDGTLTTLYNFAGGADGGGPEGDVLVSGKNIYSTTTTGGDPTCQCGGVYEVTAKGKESLLQDFTAAGGDGYSAGLTANGKSFYGTTVSGGADGDGVVFSLTKK